MPVEALPEPPAPSGWTIDKRQVIGAALGLLCLGIIIGFRLGAGSEPLVIEKPLFVEKPCAECEEKSRAEHPSAPQHVVPGDSSVPED